MKTQKECYEALCKGHTLKGKSGTTVKLNAAGKQEGRDVPYYFNLPWNWVICAEPKKKVKYYAYWYALGHDAAKDLRVTADIEGLMEKIKAYPQKYAREESMDREFDEC